MEDFITLVISALGTYFFDIDFLVLHGLIDIAITLYKSYYKNTNDKTTNE